jgi:hypothetical protein
MAHKLLDARHGLTVYDINEAAMRPLLERQARRAASVFARAAGLGMPLQKHVDTGVWGELCSERLEVCLTHRWKKRDSNFRSHLQRGASQHLLRSASDRSALFCSGRLRGVEFSIPLFDAAGPPMPGYGGADVVRASALASSGDLRLRLAVSQGKNLIIEAQRATLAAS